MTNEQEQAPTTQDYKNSQRGATAIEYALIGGFIAVAISAAVYLFGDNLTELYEYAHARFNNE